MHTYEIFLEPDGTTPIAWATRTEYDLDLGRVCTDSQQGGVYFCVVHGPRGKTDNAMKRAIVFVSLAGALCLSMVAGIRLADAAE